MHIILLILKIIGILLLSLLGILLLLILLVLFVPVRYGINGEKYEKIKANITFRWLFPVLYGKMVYAEEELVYYVKLFGFKIYPRGKKDERIKKSKKRKRKEKKEEAGRELVTMELSEKQGEAIVEDMEEITDIPFPVQEVQQDQKSYEKKSLPEKTEEQVKKNVFSKIKEFFAGIKEFFTGVKRSWILLKEKTVKFWKGLKNISRKREIIFNFIQSEENKAGFYRIITYIKKLLKHLKPGKIRGEVEFGLDDPALTGQALGVIGMFYGVYRDQVKILPNFQEAILEGNIFMKGRIRVFTLMLICIKLLLDNDFKKLTNNFNRMKEEL